MLEWCKKNESKISQPKLLNSDTKNYIILKYGIIDLHFSEPMQKSKIIDIVLIQFENGNQTQNQQNLKIENPVWSQDGKNASFKIDSKFEEYAVGLYVWDSPNGLYSTNDVLLNPQSYILVKK